MSCCISNPLFQCISSILFFRIKSKDMYAYDVMKTVISCGANPPPHTLRGWPIYTITDPIQNIYETFPFIFDPICVLTYNLLYHSFPALTLISRFDTHFPLCYSFLPLHSRGFWPCIQKDDREYFFWKSQSIKPRLNLWTSIKLWIFILL